MTLSRALAALIPLTMAGCLNQGEFDVLTSDELEIVKGFGPLVDGPPPSPTNRYADNEAAAVFGQRLFFEKGYANKLTVAGSGLGNVGDTGKVSCASCHDPKQYYSDSRSRPAMTSLGVQWTQRNSPTLVNAAYYKWGGWGGKDDAMWNQGANGSESSVNFGSNRLQYAHLVYRKYRADYDAIFPTPLDPALDPMHPDAARFPASGKPKAKGAPDGPWELMTADDRHIINTILANTGKAIEAYERKLVSQNAPIDRYILGDEAALTPAQKRGLKLFIGKAACNDCHNGPTFSDQGFHNTGVPQALSETASRVDQGQFDDMTRLFSGTFNGMGKYSDDPEYGAAKVVGMEPTDEMMGKFRTKSLRHIAETGPYMHNGAFATLEEVVQFYNHGGGSHGYEGTKSPMMVPLLLTDAEVKDLVEFLKALTGEPPPEEWGVDTAIHD